MLHGDRFILTSPPEVNGFWDREALKRVLDNLINNAIKYGEAFGPVTVMLEENEEEKNCVVIKVHNLGNPIPQEF
jgi:signal transduction histidine kinase